MEKSDLKKKMKKERRGSKVCSPSPPPYCGGVFFSMSHEGRREERHGQ